MRRFRFRLDALLRLRAHECERHRIDLARAQERVEAETLGLSEAERALRRAGDLLSRSARNGASGGELAQRERGADALHGDAALRRASATSAATELSAARTRVVDALVRVRSLERLRDRAMRAHRAREQAREQRELDALPWRAVRIGEAGA